MFKISLIPTPYKILLGVGLLVAAALGGAWLGSTQTEKSWQLKDTKRIAAEQQARLDAQAAQRTRDKLQASKAAALDAQHQKEMTDAQTEIDKLLRDARTRAVRLYAKPAKPATLGAFDSAAASSVNAEARCELDGETSADLISITADGDIAIRQLTALQDYVSIITGAAP
ncbi:lysis system i-spanin subunit Rz [Chitinibacter sp. GC72]|uniref:lysis system i-spanin subunit Rz n=1 Tax=Chitinibacter sp. GC72 TaxID=1526917 RepID=UPI0012FAE9F5|nr:lysis system i-spanin subunit Rz [Chitinibacter sp. GC72]